MSQSSLPELVVATTTMLDTFAKTLTPLIGSTLSAASRSITVVPEASIKLRANGLMRIDLRLKLSIQPNGDDTARRLDPYGTGR